MRNRSLLNRVVVEQKGVQLLEYIIGVGLLVIVFIVASRILNVASHNRVDNSIKVMEGMAPCGAAGGSLNTETGSLECM